MKVSASFLSSRDLVKDLRALDLTDVDYIHLDMYNELITTMLEHNCDIVQCEHINVYENQEVENKNVDFTALYRVYLKIFLYFCYLISF